MSLVMADQESRGVNTDDSGVDEEDSVMQENLAEGGGAVNERGGSGQVPFLLAERARSEGARSMRAVKGNLGHSLDER